MQKPARHCYRLFVQSFGLTRLVVLPLIELVPVVARAAELVVTAFVALSQLLEFAHQPDSGHFDWPLMQLFAQPGLWEPWERHLAESALVCGACTSESTGI